MTLGEWIPAFIDAYKRDTIRPDSLYTVQLVASKIPWEILAMELDEIRPMHLQRFVNAFALTASKSYMDKLHVLLNGLFVAAIDNDLCANTGRRIICRANRIHIRLSSLYDRIHKFIAKMRMRTSMPASLYKGRLIWIFNS